MSALVCIYIYICTHIYTYIYICTPVQTLTRSISRHWVINTVCLFNIKHVPLFTVSFIHVPVLITLTVPPTESCTEEAEVTGEMSFQSCHFFTYFYTFSAVQKMIIFAIITNKLGIRVQELYVTTDSSVVCCRDSRKQHWMRTLASTKNVILF